MVACTRNRGIFAMRFWMFLLGLACFLTMQMNLASLPAAAADGVSAKLTESLKPLIEQAKKDGATVLVIAPGDDADQAGNAVANPSLSDILRRAQFRLKLVLRGAGEFFHSLSQTMAKQSPDGQGWLFKVVLVAIGAIIIGRLAAKPAAIWTANTFVPRVRPMPHTRAYRLSILLFRGISFTIIAAIAGAVAALIVTTYAGSDTAAYTTGLFVVSGYIAHRFLRAVTYNLLTPSSPAYRPFPIADDIAKRMYVMLQASLIVSIAIVCVCLWMQALGLDENAHKLALIIGTGVIAILLSTVAIVFRRQVSEAILGGGASSEAGWLRQVLARGWHVFVVLYMVFAWAVSSIRILLDLPNGPGLVGEPVLIFVAAMVGYSVLVIIIDKMLGDTWLDKDLEQQNEARQREKLEAERQLQAEIAAREEATRQAALAMSAADGEIEGDNDADDVLPDTSKPDRDTSVPPSVFKPLAQHAAGVLVTLVGLVTIAAIWGVDVKSQDSLFVRFTDITIVSFLAYFAYRAVNVWVAAKREAEGDYDSAMPDEEAMHGGASRFLTLLPMFRNFLLITIVVISGMILLSELGVDIGPLFAGAGVIGLAIGFGAQTLIRDIFSGAFFLIDDAFRKGEYIDIGTAKGTVERISIRSFQLRHHRGALNTVPFGEIKQLTNYSRDWVMMKLPIRLTYDTDLEKVRKLVKRLGVELLDDPDIGQNFLQPLKSQGAMEMSDSAMIVRLKFMTKPGDQFAVRTKVLTKIRELFEKEGIKFAHREVTVRVADSADPKAVQGAAAHAVTQPEGTT